MKISYQWLKDWVKINLSAEKLADQLSLSGLEVDSCTPVAKDYVLDVQLTPNRGDCLSVIGLAREISAINSVSLISHKSPAVKVSSDKRISVNVSMEDACPRYAGRIVENVDNKISTPSWIKERLQLSGMNGVSLVVDVMNYVMLETGQPLHAFDLDKIEKSIVVRHAKRSEKLKLLDQREVELDVNTLIIADAEKPLAIAGIMGGLDSGVSDQTTSIFIESAFFAPVAIHGRARYYGLQTDASQRFERGVDPELAAKALERATELLVSIYKENKVDVKVGPVIEVASKKHLPKNPEVKLNADQVARLLGTQIPNAEIANILKRLGMHVEGKAGDWKVTAPSYRFDVLQPEDLIEEIARIYGYTNLPSTAAPLYMSLPEERQQRLSADRFSDVLVGRGYQEIITYSFVDPVFQNVVEPHVLTLELVNPIASDLSVMRTSLWPGLLSTLQYNLNRQQTRFRCFETGVCFISHKEANKLEQQPRLAGIVTGPLFQEQWQKGADADFYTIKSDVMALLSLTHQKDFTCVTAEHIALHPGQSAAILNADKKIIGYVGAFHPRILQVLDIKKPIYGFELKLNELEWAALPQYEALSVFPSVRRDIAVLLKASLSATEISKVVRDAAGTGLVDLVIFDVYQGKGIPDGFKSVALGLTLQHSQRTLTDAEVEEMIAKVIRALQEKCAAQLRT